MSFKVLVISVFCALSGFQTFAQETRALKQKGKEFYGQGRYEEAIQNLEAYVKTEPEDDKVLYLLGLCHYHQNDLRQALRYLSLLKKESKVPFDQLLLYRGKVRHALHDFQKAIDHYKAFLKTAEKDHPVRERVKADVRRCAVGLKAKLGGEKNLVENLGETINSEYDEFAPVLSPNHENRLYFSAIRKDNVGGSPNSDLFYATFIHGEWTSPKRMSYLLNSPANEVLLDFGAQGIRLYLFRGPTLFSGEILVDTFRQDISDRSMAEVEFSSPMKPWEGDCAPYFFNDSTLLFASRREGGFGGLDIYITTLQKGKWTAPQNLGPTINSDYDETSPFLAKDGRTLYFSSNNSRRSMGGLDILKSVFDDYSENWTEPENLKIPVNSAGDEAHFRLSKDGLKAWFSSSRKTISFGEQDLYAVYFNAPQRAHLLVSEPLLFTEVSINKKAIAEADFSEKPILKNHDTFPNQEVREYTIEPLFYNADGNILTEENTAKLDALIGMLKEHPQLKIIMTGHTDNPTSQKLALFFSITRAEAAAGYLLEKGVPSTHIFLKGVGAAYPLAQNETNGRPNSAGQSLNRRVDISIANYRGLPIRIIHKNPVVGESMKAGGSQFFRGATQGLSYKIQIASLKQIYRGDALTQYPDAMVESTPNSEFYDYSIGLYQTFHSADLLRKDLIRQGTLNGSVIAYINGVRISPEVARQYAGAYPDLENYER